MAEIGWCALCEKVMTVAPFSHTLIEGHYYWVRERGQPRWEIMRCFSRTLDKGAELWLQTFNRPALLINDYNLEALEIKDLPEPR